MPYDPSKHHRRSIRLKGYDYRKEGAYFVTICVEGHVCRFGTIQSGRMRLSAEGRVARDCWLALPDHFDRAVLDAFVVMPNHVHGIVFLMGPPPTCAPSRTDDTRTFGGRNADDTRTNVGARHAVPLPGIPRPPWPPSNAVPAPGVERFGRPVPGSLPTLVRSYKSAVTKRINAMTGTPGARLWQRNYYEHVIRTDDALRRIRWYIAQNPARWRQDRFYLTPRS
ncbi:transposase [Rhodocaloribacter sp.]